MINLKVLLRLATAGILTTVAATSVVACGKPDSGTTMDAKVSQNLGLTNDKGEGLIKGSIDVTKPAVAVWKTSLVTQFLATKLVTGSTGQVPGKDSDSTAFLKNVLKLKADADDKFTYSDVAEITAVVDTINPTIEVNSAKNDYVIKGGTFMLQFYAKDKTTKLGDNNKINLAVDLATGIVNDAIPNLKIADFDTTGEFSTFKVGQPVTDFEKKIIKLATTTDLDKQMVQIMKLLGNLPFFFIVDAQTDGGPGSVWKASDSLTLIIFIGTESVPKLAFDKNIVLNPNL